MEPNPSSENPRFSLNDLVWGKIKSHPWWPGQIIDPKHASEYGTKKQKQDHFLVAYFTDKSFAWVQESQLKHFVPHFSEMKNQKGPNVFLTAVSDAVLEYSRRIELGLACNCRKDNILVGLKNREIVNAGVREGVCNEGVIVSDFLPRSFVNFIRAFAFCPVGEICMLDRATIIGQMKAFRSWRGNNELSVLYEYNADFLENDGKNEGELSVKSEKKRGRHCKIQVEAEEKESEDIGNERKGKRMYVKKENDEKHSHVEFDSGEKVSNVEESGAKLDKKRGRPRKSLDKVEKNNNGEEKSDTRKYVGKVEGQASAKSEKKRGRSRKIQVEVEENGNEGIVSEVKDKQMEVQKVYDENHSEVKTDSAVEISKVEELGVKSDGKRGRRLNLEVVEEKEKEAFIEEEKALEMNVCKVVGQSSVKSEKKRGRPRKILKEGEENEKKDLGGEKNDNVEIQSSAKSERKRGRPRKYQKEGEDKHIAYLIGDEKVCNLETKDHILEMEVDSNLETSDQKEREKNTINSISASSELGRGKRVKRKKEFDSPSLTRTKQTGHKDRIKQSATRAKKSLTGAKLDGLFAEDYSSPLEMVSQLYSLALDPTDATDFLPVNKKFFTHFKNFISSKLKEEQNPAKSAGSKRGRKKKEPTSGPASVEMFEAEHVQDSYWSDIVFEGAVEKDGL